MTKNNSRNKNNKHTIAKSSNHGGEKLKKCNNNGQSRKTTPNEIKAKFNQSPSKKQLGTPHDECASETNGLSALQLKFQKKIEGARFRTINERLYSCRGDSSFSEFQTDQTLFDIYHSGYREQVKSWPENPLDIVINWIKKKHPKGIIADMGCGEARLAQSIPNKVHSFDLVARSPDVTACDISHVPLENQSVDVAVFCLSLMGTNIGEFLEEAHRILRPQGVLKIAEVRSRFEGEENGLTKFFKTLKRAGFDIIEKVFGNKMFFLLECVKTTRIKEIDYEFSAKACMYKKR